MEANIPDILSFINTPVLANISQGWRSHIEENNRNIIEGLFEKYPDAQTIHEVMIEAFNDDDTESIRKMIFEYIGYVPISWYNLIQYVQSIKTANLLVSKLIDQRDLSLLGTRMEDIQKVYNTSVPSIYYDIVPFASLDKMWALSRLSENQRKVIADSILDMFRQTSRDWDGPNERNIDRWTIHDLQGLRNIIEWLDHGGYIPQDNTLRLIPTLARLNRIIKERNLEEVPTDPNMFRTYLLRAAFNGRLDILDKYATKGNILEIVISSFNAESDRIPTWMYQFLTYKAGEWRSPIDAWIAHIVDGHSTTRTPPVDFWRKILGTAAMLSPRSNAAVALANKLIAKYNNQLTSQMKQKIRQLSQGTIQI